MKTWKMQLVIIKLLHCQPHEGSCRISKSSEPRGLQLLDVKTSPASDWQSCPESNRTRLAMRRFWAMKSWDKRGVTAKSLGQKYKRASTRHIAVQHLFFFLRKLLWLETNHWSRQTRVVLEVSVPCQHQCHQCLQFLSDQLQNRSLRTATDVFLLCSNVQKRSFPELR